MKNTPFNKAVQDIQKMSMTHAEKQAVLSRIRDSVFAENGNVAPIKSPWSIYSFGSFVMRNVQMHKFASVAAAFLIVAISGNSIVLAANEALPGDALYSFKVNVAEPVRIALAADPVKKAEIQTSFVQNRFEEAETLAARGQLDDIKEQELSDLIDRHVASVSANIEKIEEASPEKAQNSSIAVEASMNAHAKILTSLNTRAVNSQSRNTTRIADKARKDAKKFDQVMALRSASPDDDQGRYDEDSAPVSAMMSVSVPVTPTEISVATEIMASTSTIPVASSTRAAIEVKKQQVEAEIFQKANKRLEKEWKNEELKKRDTSSKDTNTSRNRSSNSGKEKSDRDD